jgi:F-type H+-transporting ATPase subunit gamma
MASLRQLRRRIKSVSNIHEITKAMEMIAAFRFKRAESRFVKTRAYTEDLEKIVSDLSRSKPGLSDPLFARRGIRKKMLVLMSADKGLCGAYNANLVRAALRWMEDNRSFETTLVPVGKVGAEYFRRRGLKFAAVFPEKTRVDFAMARRIAENLKQFYLSGQADQVEILYTPYRAGSMGVQRLLPYLNLAHFLTGGKNDRAEDYICEPDFGAVFSELLTQYLAGKMYLLILESLTSELNARRLAMSQATQNGEEVLDRLTLVRNKTRQATITRELTEIVSAG